MITEFRMKRRVQFYETDAAGIVHFSNYFRFIEEAEHAMWREAGLSIAEAHSDIGWPRVAVSFDYYKPLRFEDEFEILIRIKEISEKRITYTCTLSLAGVRVAVGSMTVACVSRKPNQPMKSVSIPVDIASRFGIAPEGQSGS